MSFFTPVDTKDIMVAMNAGNHDFTVVKKRINFDDGITLSGIGIPDYVAIVKESNNQYLGTVGVGWQPVQPSTLYELAQELLDTTNGKINGVLNMFDGSVIGISFELAQREYIPEDLTNLNFLMMTAFNGTHGIAGHSTIYRMASSVSCCTSNKVYNLKHTKNVMNRIQVVKEMLRYYEREIEMFDKRMNYLVNHRMNQNAAVEWFKTLFPVPSSERQETIINNQTAIFIDCLNNGRGSNITGVRGTCYGAFQALTEYVNYHRSIKVHNGRDEDEVRFQTVHFGSGNTLAQKALNTISAGFTEFSEEEFLIQ